MRLTPAAARIIHDAARTHFGDDAEVWLFGSRVDDTRRGGDIDLYVETDLADPAEIAQRKTKFLAALYLRIGEQKIDLLVKPRSKEEMQPIYGIAREQGIQL